MRRWAWLVVAALAVLGVLFLAVFPARDWWAQRHERRQLAARVQTLVDQNRLLEQRAAQLGTPAEIERLARQHYDLVRPGEEAYAIIPSDPPGPADDGGPAARR
jgi:cell division protein FtsB